VIFNAKIYKDLLTKKNTSEKDPKVAPWSTPEQHDADSEFVELDVPVKKIWSIMEGNKKLRVQPPTSQSELKRSTRTTITPEIILLRCTICC